MLDMAAGINCQSIHGSYIYSTPSDQVLSMDSNHTNGLPLNQPIMSSGYVDMDQPICMDSNGICSYPLCQVYSQPPSQAILPSDTSPLDNNNVHTSGNTQSNPVHYGYSAMNDDLTNYIHHPLPQTSGQTPPTSTRPYNTGMTTNTTSHGYVVIIVKADIDLGKLLSVIQSCEREERI